MTSVGVPGTDLDDEQSRRGQRMPRSERRAQLLDAAQSVFVEAGYHSAVMDEIAERAGVSKPVLYQHFPSKLELYLALLDQFTDELLGLLQGALHRTDGNKAKVMATVATYFEYVAQEGGSFRLIFESDLRNEAEVSSRLDSFSEACARAMAKAISADTSLSPADAHLLGMALTGMAQIAARDWLAQGVRVPREEAARVVGQLAWRGLGGFPKRDLEPPAGLS
jgi:AcrR family transcriptional regulator